MGEKQVLTLVLFVVAVFVNPRANSRLSREFVQPNVLLLNSPIFFFQAVSVKKKVSVYDYQCVKTNIKRRNKEFSVRCCANCN